MLSPAEKHQITVREWEQAEPVLKDWLRRARESQHTHYEAARDCNVKNGVLHLPVAALNTIMATGAFLSLQSPVGAGWIIAFGIASIVAAFLVAIQSSLKLVERGERHRRLASGYSAERRTIEELLALPHEQRGEVHQTFSRIKTELDHLAQESPDIPRRIWRRSLKIAEGDRLLSREQPTEYDSLMLDRGDDAESSN